MRSTQRANNNKQTVLNNPTVTNIQLCLFLISFSWTFRALSYIRCNVAPGATQVFLANSTATPYTQSMHCVGHQLTGAAPPLFKKKKKKSLHIVHKIA